MPNTYAARVAHVAATLRDWACIGPGGATPDATTRARAAKWLGRAYGRVPRPHMESVAPPGTWLPRLVGRIRQLEGELYHRLLRVGIDADPLPEEARALRHQNARFKREAAEPLLFIPSDWDGEPTVAGDYCLDALLEVLCDADRVRAGQAGDGEGPAGFPGRQALDAGPLPARGPARLRAGQNPSCVLAGGR